jgi:hypothetical protein
VPLPANSSSGGGWRQLVARDESQRRQWQVGAAVFLLSTGNNELDAWVAPRRGAAIARITKTAGHSPENPDRLASDIFDACSALPAQLDPLQARTASQHLTKVRRILRAVEKQAALIDSDPDLHAAIKGSRGVQLSAFTELHFELQALESSLRLLAQKWRSKADLPVALKGRRPSELEWLAGVSFPLIYERHFLRRAGRSRKKEGEPAGPMVRFIEATLRELGISYSRESIVRAFTRLAALRPSPSDKGR